MSYDWMSPLRFKGDAAVHVTMRELLVKGDPLETWTLVGGGATGRRGNKFSVELR